MADTVYSHALRILTCARCGAPLEASVEGGELRCGYCGAVQVLSRREEERDRRRPSEGRDLPESERVARLRAQERLDTPLPPAVARMLVDGALRREAVAAARAAWKEARARVPDGRSSPLEEKLYHLTLALEPCLPERERRSLLETAVEVLPDRGHRQVLRCRLAFLAACAGDVRAATEWLEVCDARPTQLASDSAYRVAAAAIAAAEGDPSGVIAQLGTEQGDVPMARSLAPVAFYLRVDALERSGSLDAAVSELRARTRLGADLSEELAALGALDPCPRSLAIVRAEIERERRAHRRQLAQRALVEAELILRSHQRKRGDMLLASAAAAVLATVGAGLAWSILFTGILELDPLFGAHSALFCPVVCDDCTGPYEFRHWPRAYGQGDFFAVHCQRVGPDGARGRGPALTSGSLQIILTTIPCASPVGLLAGGAVALSLRRKRRRRRALLQSAVDEAERRLSAARGPPGRAGSRAA